MNTALISFAISLAVTLSWVNLTAQRQAAPAGAVAYISAQRITSETTEGKAGLARRTALQRELAADLRQKQQALEATRNQLPLAQADARVRLQAQEQQQRTELERAAAKAQADIQTLQRQTSDDALVRVRSVVGELVKGRDIQVVLNLENAIVWAAPSLDLTDEVIARMNSSSPPK